MKLEKVFIISLFILLFGFLTVNAVEFTPQGDINLRGIYSVINAVDINGSSRGISNSLYSCVVAADGSGDYTTIQECIDSMNNGSILIKCGDYLHTSSIRINRSNLYITGEGSCTNLIADSSLDIFFDNAGDYLETDEINVTTNVSWGYKSVNVSNAENYSVDDLVVLYDSRPIEDYSEYGELLTIKSIDTANNLIYFHDSTVFSYNTLNNITMKKVNSTITDVRLTNFKATGAGNTYEQDFMNMYGIRRWTIDHLDISKFEERAIYIAGAYDVEIHSNKIRDTNMTGLGYGTVIQGRHVSVHDNIYSNNRHGTDCGSTSIVSAWSMQNEFKNNLYYGAKVTTSAVNIHHECPYTRVVGNLVLDSYNGLSSEADYTVFQGNTIRNVERIGINTAHGWFPKGIIVKDNTIEHVASTNFLGSGYGIYINAENTSSIIEGNVLLNISGTGILCDECEDAIIKDNTLIDVTIRGIWVYARGGTHNLAIIKDNTLLRTNMLSGNAAIEVRVENSDINISYCEISENYISSGYNRGIVTGVTNGRCNNLSIHDNTIKDVGSTSIEVNNGGDLFLYDNLIHNSNAPIYTDAVLQSQIHYSSATFKDGIDMDNDNITQIDTLQFKGNSCIWDNGTTLRFESICTR